MPPHFPLGGLYRRCALLPVACGAVAFACISAASADAQQVRYTVAPRVLQVQWDDALAFDRVTMPGVSLVADFGEWVSLEAHAAAGRDLRARFAAAGLMDTTGAPASDADLEVSRVGLALRVNAATARIAPFARAGGDVLRFDSPDGRVVRTVALHYGGGIRTTLGSRWRAELFAEDLRFEVDRSQLAPGVAAGSDSDAAVQRRNLVLGASLGYAFGGPPADSTARTRFSLLSVPVEAFGGQLRFADRGIPDATVAGVRLGVNVGPNVGLRAYHLKRVGEHPDVQGEVSSNGLEVKFNLNAVPRLAPYLIVGGGRMNFSPDFRGSDGQPRSDHGLLILGGGLGFRLSDQFRVDASIRDLISAGDDPLTTVGSTSELRHAVLLAAGVTFSIGRSRRGSFSLVRDSAPDPTERRRRVASGDELGGAAGDSADAGAATASAVRNHQSDRLVTIPLPQEGELYLRYGPADTSRARALRQQDGEADTLRIQALVRREVERLLAERGATPAPAPVVVPPTTIVVPRDAPAAAQVTVLPRSAGDTADARRLTLERDQARAEVEALRARLAALESALDTTANELDAVRDSSAAARDSLRDKAAADSATGARRREALRRLRAARQDVVGVVEHPRGLVVTLGSGLFGSEAVTFDDAGREALALVAALADAYPDAAVAVEGHTDALGDEAYNQILSERRAEFVRNALVRAGIAPRRVNAAGFGPHHPVADNGTAAGRARNRRVEVVLVGAAAPPPAAP